MERRKRFFCKRVLTGRLSVRRLSSLQLKTVSIAKGFLVGTFLGLHPQNCRVSPRSSCGIYPADRSGGAALGTLEMHANPLTLEDLVEKTIDLPSLPAAALAVVRETEQPSASAHTIAQYVAQDQALAARILRLANSNYYGLSRQVMDVSDAVVILGMRCIRNLCMVASTYPWMVNPSNGYGLGPRDIWTHSFAVAVGAQIVADRAGSNLREQALTAGLMHNLGKMALGVWHEKDMPAILALARSADIPAEEAERQILGYSHCEVGLQMAEAWNLPKPLVEVMGYHHDPNSCGDKNPLVDCVHVADYLTMSMGLGLGGDGARYDFHPESLERLGIPASSLEGLANECESAFAKHEKLFDLAA